MRIKLVVFTMLIVRLISLPLIAQSPLASASDRPLPQGKTLELTKLFHTRSPWRLVVTEGPQTEDYGGNAAPGALTICLRQSSSGPCVSGPVFPPLRSTSADAPAWEPHYLLAAKAVYPHDVQAEPFLMIVTGSLYSGDGDQIEATQLISYDTASDTFHRVYGVSTGHNNNQEIRFIADGPLRGSVIYASPQQHLPYGFWIEVNQLNAAGEYHQVLRYGSATHYNDGNRLAVIDSEMPNIQKRLGLWKPSDPLPAPKSCHTPVLRHDELWCE